jgi:threonine dehydrogenase-like Zn-dependent dehydrogenase
VATPNPTTIPLTITAITATAATATTVIVITLLKRKRNTAKCVMRTTKIPKVTTPKIVAFSIWTGQRNPGNNCSPKSKSTNSSTPQSSAERITAMKRARAAAEDVLPAAGILAAAAAAAVAAAAADPTIEMMGTTPTQI